MINISPFFDEHTVRIYAVVDQVTSSLGVDYLVVGATARDLVLHYGFGARIASVTKDVDFGIHVASWSQFDDVRSNLIDHGFVPDKNRLHRFEDVNGLQIDVIPFGGLQIDVIPFGGLESSHSTLEWPPSGEVVMNVLGFEQALADSEWVRISENPTLDIRVATPRGIALLKSISWVDRARDIRAKDAKDLAYTCETYERLPEVQDRIYSTSELERFGYDQTITGSYLLGKDVATISNSESRDQVRRLFHNEIRGCTFEQLVLESCSSARTEFSRNETLLEAFFSGHSEVERTE